MLKFIILDFQYLSLNLSAYVVGTLNWIQRVVQLVC